MVYKSGQIFLPFCRNPRVWRTDRQTDRRTDRILLAIPRLHYMQRGNKTHKNADGHTHRSNFTISLLWLLQTHRMNLMSYWCHIVPYINKWKIKQILGDSGYGFLGFPRYVHGYYELIITSCCPACSGVFVCVQCEIATVLSRFDVKTLSDLVVKSNVSITIIIMKWNESALI